MEDFFGQIIVQVIAGVILLVVGSIMAVHLKDRPGIAAVVVIGALVLGALVWVSLRKEAPSPQEPPVVPPAVVVSDGPAMSEPQQPPAIVSPPVREPAAPTPAAPAPPPSPIQRARLLADDLAGYQWGLEGQCGGQALNIAREGDTLAVWPAGGRPVTYALVRGQGNVLGLRVDGRDVSIEIQGARYRYTDQGRSRWFDRCP